jgi:hypothetical protein
VDPFTEGLGLKMAKEGKKRLLDHVVDCQKTLGESGVAVEFYF